MTSEIACRLRIIEAIQTIPRIILVEGFRPVVADLLHEAATQGFDLGSRVVALEHQRTVWGEMMRLSDGAPELDTSSRKAS